MRIQTIIASILRLIIPLVDLFTEEEYSRIEEEVAVLIEEEEITEEEITAQTLDKTLKGSGEPILKPRIK